MQSETTVEVGGALESARACCQELDFPKANQLLEEFVRSGTDSDEARLWLGETSLVVGRWERAQRELERLLESSQGEHLVRAGLGLAELSSTRGEPEPARDILARIIETASELEDRRWMLQVLVRQAALAGMTGEMDSSRSLLERAEQMAEPFRGDSTWVEALAALDTQWGLNHFRLSQRLQAEERLERALAGLRGQGLKSLEEALILRYQGVMASLRREYRRSLQLHLEALHIYLKAGHRYGQAKAYDSIGRTLQGANHLDEAAFTFKKAESLCRRLGANAELATLYGKLGQVAMLRDDLDGAIRYFQKDLELSTRYRNYYALGYSYRNLGRCLLQVGRFDEAVLNLKESLGLFQYVEDWVNLGQVYMDLGFAHAKAGQSKDAAEVRARAGSLLQEHNLAHETPFLCCLDGILARGEGRFEEAERHFREGIDQLEGKASGRWLSETYYELGLLYRQMKSENRAIDAFKAAVRTARSAGLARQVGRYLQELEDLNEVELFRVWMEDLPVRGGPGMDSGERQP
jgi:tetratricopeptide (TPR) repeat protein